MEVLSPLPGRVVPMADVPDPVFAQDLVGPGAAIDPPREPVTALAPVSGRLVKLHPHAFVVQAASGQGVLVHCGIDTVQLEGRGFSVHVAEGDEVVAGQAVVSFDAAEVEAGGRSPVCPVVALDASPDDVRLVAVGVVDAGEPLLAWSSSE